MDNYIDDLKMGIFTIVRILHYFLQIFIMGLFFPVIILILIGRESSHKEFDESSIKLNAAVGVGSFFYLVILNCFFP